MTFKVNPEHISLVGSIFLILILAQVNAGILKIQEEPIYRETPNNEVATNNLIITCLLGGNSCPNWIKYLVNLASYNVVEEKITPGSESYSNDVIKRIGRSNSALHKRFSSGVRLTKRTI
uniref:Uncharacterized protein n=1 Tax=Lepeophtheirus salmonis TaxID=72036 RepID=A0A0K2T528_LEPSM